MDPRPLHFLLVEDDEDHAHLVKVTLKEGRIANTVEHVYDGEEALAYVRGEKDYGGRQRPDVILLDLRLPKIDGHQVLKEIKEDEKLRKIPVVVLTSSEAEADRSRAYGTHANSYITKPLDFAQFQQMVRDLQLYWSIWNQPPANGF